MEQYIIPGITLAICIVTIALVVWRDHRANVREAQLQQDLDTLSDERDQLASHKNKAVKALREIEEGKAPYSRDQLTFANNTIEHLTSIARAVLAEFREGGIEITLPLKPENPGTPFPKTFTKGNSHEDT